MLTKEQLQTYEDTGVLCLENFASPEECAAMKRRGHEIVEDFDPKSFTIFSTRHEGEPPQYKDNYFNDSSSNISCFFEEKAFDKQGNLAQPKQQSINKIGHALHDLDPVFRAFSGSDKVQQLMRDLGYKQPLPIQSTFIFKQPRIGGEVAVHQDCTFLYTDPPTVVGLWVALEDATKENGCLWTIYGSHKEGQPRRRFYRGADGNLTFDKPSEEYDLSKFEPLEVKPDTRVNRQCSADNLSPKSRCAYILHAFEGPEQTWAKDNWLQRAPELPLKPIYDATGQQAAEAVAAH